MDFPLNIYNLFSLQFYQRIWPCAHCLHTERSSWARYRNSLYFSEYMFLKTLGLKIPRALGTGNRNSIRMENKHLRQNTGKRFQSDQKNISGMGGRVCV